MAQCTRLSPLHDLRMVRCVQLYPTYGEVTSMPQAHDNQVIMKQSYYCIKTHPHIFIPKIINLSIYLRICLISTNYAIQAPFRTLGSTLESLFFNYYEAAIRFMDNNKCNV